MRKLAKGRGSSDIAEPDKAKIARPMVQLLYTDQRAHAAHLSLSRPAWRQGSCERMMAPKRLRRGTRPVPGAAFFAKSLSRDLKRPFKSGRLPFWVSPPTCAPPCP